MGGSVRGRGRLDLLELGDMTAARRLDRCALKGRWSNAIISSAARSNVSKNSAV